MLCSCLVCIDHPINRLPSVLDKLATASIGWKPPLTKVNTVLSVWTRWFSRRCSRRRGSCGGGCRSASGMEWSQGHPSSASREAWTTSSSEAAVARRGGEELVA
uniref:CESAB n=1 Tax=Arundo donax TaxID=35708 RepID=A0A0A8Z1A6_ARUDO